MADMFLYARHDHVMPPPDARETASDDLRGGRLPPGREAGVAGTRGGLLLATALAAGGMAAILALLASLHPLLELPPPDAESWGMALILAFSTGAAGALPATLLALRWRARERSARQSAQALAQRLRALDELVPAVEESAVILRRMDGTIRKWSTGCERLLGFPAAEAKGRLAQELLRTRFPCGGRRTAQAALLRDGEWRGELRHRCRDGTTVVVASHWILQRDPITNEPGGVVELHADATALKLAEVALRAGEARLRLAQDVAGIGTWEWDPEADVLVWSAEQHALFGTSPAGGTPAALEEFLDLIYPEDRKTVRQALYFAVEDGEYEAEFRVVRRARRPDGTLAEELRWIIGRGRRMPGLAGRLGPVLGVHVDITARKQTEEHQALLMREVDHRAKNVLAVVQAILRLTRADSAEAFARAVEGRVAALARAQTLLAATQWSGAELRAIIEGELAPFMDAEVEEDGRITLDGPDLVVPPLMAQPLSMALHELATNAAKYGALSTPEGRLAVAWSVAPDRAVLRLRWIERDGPPPGTAPLRRGFGTRMVEATVRDQLGGTIVADQRPEGLSWGIEVPLERNAGARAPRAAPAET